MSRFTILATMLIGAVLFVTLIAFVNRNHQDAQQDKRDQNLRQARLANGLPEYEIDPKAELLPKAVADKLEYEFGYLEDGAQCSHAFEIRNEGKAPLELTAQRPSCGCLQANLGKRLLQPGEKTTLELVFRPDGKTGNVMQGVAVSTNDPFKKELRFGLVGQTRQVFWVDHKEIAFTDLQPDEARDFHLHIFSSYEDGFEVLDLKTLAGFMQLKQEPVSLDSLPDDLEAKKDAKSAHRITVHCPSDLREIGGGISFSLKHGDSEKTTPYKMEINGSRLGRISIHGDLLDSTGRMKFGQLLVGEGKKMIYAVKVRGADRELKVKSINTIPPGVLVSFEPANENSATTGLYRMIVEVPKDLPEQSHMGKNAGKITIEFEKPTVNPIEFQFQFSIVKAKSIE